MQNDGRRVKNCKKCLTLFLFCFIMIKSPISEYIKCGSVAQLVRAPACHAGGRGFEPLPSRHLNKIWEHSSAGRASALQAEGHRFEPYCSHFLCRCGGIGRRKGLKIPRGQPRTGSSPVTGIKFSLYRDIS